MTTHIQHNAPPKYLSKDEIKLLLSNIKNLKLRKGSLPSRYIDLAFKLALYAGLRVSEIVKLTPGDVTLDDDFQEIRILNSKNGRSRNIPIINSPLVSLFEYLNLEPLHYFNPKDVFIPRSTRQVWALFKKLYLVSNIPFNGCHQLRHTYARRMIALGGLKTPDVQYLLGHSSSRTTERYIDAEFTSNNPYIYEAMLKIKKFDYE